MILIEFPDAGTERQALGKLAGRFSFKTFAGGETAVPQAALSFLALEGLTFTVKGPASYEQIILKVRDSAAALVQ